MCLLLLYNMITVSKVTSVLCLHKSGRVIDVLIMIQYCGQDDRSLEIGCGKWRDAQMNIRTNSEEETFELGRKMGMQARPGEIIAMTGDLGCGKTVFTKGFAKGLGIEEPVTSPTFTIMQVYEGGRLPLYHFDVYRIEEPEEMEEIGYSEYFFGEGVTLVEWAGLIGELFPGDTIRIDIRKNCKAGDDVREITVEGLPEGENI